MTPHVKIPKRQRQQPADADGNGVVNIHDLIFIASHFGQKGQSPADVNGDRNVDIRDLVLAAALMGEEAAAPSRYAFGGLHREDMGLQTGDIHAWIAQAQWLDLRDPTLEKGVAVLKTPYRSANAKRDRPFTELPQPIQS